MNSERPLINRITDLLPKIYEILLLVENDTDNHRNNCNWTYVKKKFAKGSIKNEVEDQKNILCLDTERNGEKLELKMIKKGSIASGFLVNTRDAFAHNRMRYDPNKKIITFEMGNFNGSITEETFKEVIGLIKESKIQSVNSKKK